MNGSLAGNIIALIYYLIYQVVGILLSMRLLKKESISFRVLMGSILGTVALHWCPAIIAIAMGFGVCSHVAGLLLFLIPSMVILTRRELKEAAGEAMIEDISGFLQELSRHKAFAIAAGGLWVFFLVLLLNHTIPKSEYGAYMTGQCTYGDMSMHLGFITGLAQQQTFPPDYTILKGSRLCYPFLCDSISSSLCVLGAGLRFAYILPMLFAFVQVEAGFYALAQTFLKKRGRSLLAWILFFFNGGFGFIYFFDGAWKDPSVFTRFYTNYYETPTNLVDKMIRWTNVVVDMLLPQRATLFGWAVLFGTLALLYRAIRERNRKYFILVGLIGGALPMIHTHSFLALGMVCAVWLLADLCRNRGMDKEKKSIFIRIYLPVFLIGMSVMQFMKGLQENFSKTGITLAVAMTAVLVASILMLLKVTFDKGEGQIVLKTWGTMLVIVLLEALPQLFTWTFNQVGGNGSLEGHFNWANGSDPYLWFYIKNLGVSGLLMLPALLWANRSKFAFAAPAVFIWSIAEVISFQPNTYDNNKLLYVAYALLVILVADFCGDMREKILSSVSKRMIAPALTVLLFLSMISAVMTMIRECKSGADYEIYSAEQIQMAEYVRENTDPKATFLTGTGFLNSIPVLGGRTIICGPGLYLYFHGLDYQSREADVRNMYEYPWEYQYLFDTYDVDYIVIRNSERYEYNVNEAALMDFGDVVYQQDGSVIIRR